MPVTAIYVEREDLTGNLLYLPRRHAHDLNNCPHAQIEDKDREERGWLMGCSIDPLNGEQIYCKHCCFTNDNMTAIVCSHPDVVAGADELREMVNRD